MHKEFLSLTSTICALLVVFVSIVAATFYKRKYNQQNVGFIDSVLVNNFVTKLLTEVSTQSSKQINFSNLIENVKNFFRFTEVSLHEIHSNKVIPIAGSLSQTETREHLEKNLPIVHATIQSNSHYCSILDDKNSHIYVIPINGVKTKMIFAAKTKQRDTLTKIDMETLTKSIRRILEICDALDK